MQGFFPASLILESKRIFSFFLSSKLFKMFLLYMQIRSTVDLAESIQGRPFQPSVSGHHVSFQQKKNCLPDDGFQVSRGGASLSERHKI